MTLPELEEDVGYMNTDSVPEQSDTVAQSLEERVTMRRGRRIGRKEKNMKWEYESII